MIYRFGTDLKNHNLFTDFNPMFTDLQILKSITYVSRDVTDFQNHNIGVPVVNRRPGHALNLSKRTALLN